MRDTKRTRTILGLLLLTSLTVVVLGLRGGGAGARQTASGVFGPVENAASAVVRPVRDFLSSITSLGSKDQQISDLQRQVDALQQQLTTSQYEHNRAQELNDLLRLAGAGQYKTLPAQVIAFGPAQGFAWTVTIDVGSRDGVKVDQDVVNGQGLVGRVVATTSTTATVALLVDATATVGARIESSMEVGFLNGTGDPRTLQLQLLDPFAPVTVGDRLVSFGVKGGAYVPGIPLGTITAVSGTPGQLTRIATVAPFVDVTSLDLVGVIVQPPRTDPRDAVLPPKPTPSASGTPSGSATATATPGTSTPSGSASPGPNASATGG
ncbi:MAG TPA: rod shape-determining protein MreC [Propionibacteriaceae bacterium]|nr:rod shape-determining protein MreC [Propionibacteriaceae bacterium]